MLKTEDPGRCVFLDIEAIWTIQDEEKKLAQLARTGWEISNEYWSTITERFEWFSESQLSEIMKFGSCGRRSGALSYSVRSITLKVTDTPSDPLMLNPKDAWTSHIVWDMLIT